jgi:hypothetical protein
MKVGTQPTHNFNMILIYSLFFNLFSLIWEYFVKIAKTIIVKDPKPKLSALTDNKLHNIFAYDLYIVLLAIGDFPDFLRYINF